MKTIRLTINTKSQKYSILIGRKLAPNLSKVMNYNSLKFKKCLLVIDKNVPKNLVFQIKRSLRKKKNIRLFF